MCKNGVEGFSFETLSCDFCSTKIWLQIKMLTCVQQLFCNNIVSKQVFFFGFFSQQNLCLFLELRFTGVCFSLSQLPSGTMGLLFYFSGATIRGESVCLSSRWQRIRALAVWSEQGSSCSAPHADVMLRPLEVWRLRICERVSAVFPPPLIRLTLITSCTPGHHICVPVCQVSLKLEHGFLGKDRM